MRRTLLALLILVLVIGGSWITYRVTAQEKTPPPPDYEIYTVGKGDIASTVSATGSIEPLTQANLSFRTSGLVQEVLVQVGDKVETGQVLARLNTNDLMLTREQAAAGLRLAEARLAQLKKATNTAELAAAQASLESGRASLAAARASYQNLLSGPTASQRRSAEASVKRAAAILQQAQSAYDQIASSPSAGMLPQAVQLQQATIDYELAKSNAESSLAGPTAAQKASALAQIAQAQAAVAQAEATLARLQSGPAAEDVEILLAQIDQARVSMKQSENALANAELVAPISAVVGDVNIRPNEVPSPGLAAIILTDPGRYHLELNVDEVDISRLSEGQPVQISVDALANANITGTIGRIAPIAASGLGSNVVTYRVNVDINPTDEPLRSGMTATVSITTAEARDVVVIPNRVIRLDKQTGKAYVEKLVNGIPERIEIQTGLRNEQFSEVLSGLEASDQLAVRRTDTGEVIRQQMFGGG